MCNRNLKESKTFKYASSAVKPFLTAENKLEILFCLQYLELDDTFSDMMHHVYIDEKWFCITKTSRSYIVLPWMKYFEEKLYL